MTALFYLLAAVAVVATLLCITERHPVHAIVYLVTSFFSLAVIFYLLAAPLVAVFEVIIYAGAIMVLFLFIIMMLHEGERGRGIAPRVRDWLAPGLIALLFIAAVTALVTVSATTGGETLTIRGFAATLFADYGAAVEVISMQLLFALVGALYLGRKRQ